MVLATAVTWLPIGVLVAQTTSGPLSSTPWYYWNLADTIAHVGHVPQTSTEWGTTLPFLDDYHLFSTATAMLLAQDAGAGVLTLQVVTGLSVLLLGCSAALLASAFDSGRLASLAAVPIAVGTGVGALRSTSYRPEAFALGLALLLVAMFVGWLQRGERGSLLVACALTALLSKVHGIALLTAGSLVVGSMLALCPRHGAWSFLRRCALSGVALGASGLMSAIVFGGSSGTEHASNLSDRSGLADPTWEFIRAIQALPPSTPPTSEEIASDVISSVYQASGWWIGLAVVVATAVLVGGAARGSSGARRVLTFTVASLIGLLALAALFAFGWSSYVPRRTGASRLLQEATLLVGPYVACALGLVRLPVHQIARQRFICTAAILILCAAGLEASSRLERNVERQRPDPSVQQALASLKMRPDSVVLANAYTEGYIERVTRAEGLLEGRAPYTYPRVLRRANALLREAAAFYENPAGGSAFLETNNVAYVLLSRSGSYSLGTGNTFDLGVRPSRLNASPRLVRVLSSRDLTVFRVVRVPSARDRVGGSRDSTPSAGTGDKVPATRYPLPIAH
jgi:hypothetical protein